MRASMKPHPLFFAQGSGPRLTDIDGNTYLDYVLGWGPLILGHAHPALTQAVAARVPLGATFGACHVLEYEAAERVLAAIPGTERVLWSNTGSEATQVALRLARAATGRQRFLKVIGHYHGWADEFLLGYRPDSAGHLDSFGTLGQRESVLRYVDGTTVAFQGDAPEGDGFWLPAMVVESADVTEPVWREEVFGPVVAVMPFDDEDEAVALANDSAYGLSGSIFTNDLGRALRVSRRVQTGNLSVNSHSSVRYWTPFGGYKMSGLGRELGPDAPYAFTEEKNVFIAT